MNDLVCEQCGSHYQTTPSGSIQDGGTCDCGGRIRPYFNQPSPTAPDGRLRNMVDNETGKDEGGNPLGEGTITAAKKELAYWNRVNIHQAPPQGEFNYGEASGNTNVPFLALDRDRGNTGEKHIILGNPGDTIGHLNRWRGMQNQLRPNGPLSRGAVWDGYINPSGEFVDDGWYIKPSREDGKFYERGLAEHLNSQNYTQQQQSLPTRDREYRAPKPDGASISPQYKINISPYQLHLPFDEQTKLENALHLPTPEEEGVWNLASVSDIPAILAASDAYDPSSGFNWKKFDFNEEMAQEDGEQRAYYSLDPNSDDHFYNVNLDHPDVDYPDRFNVVRRELDDPRDDLSPDYDDDFTHREIEHTMLGHPAGQPVIGGSSVIPTTSWDLVHSGGSPADLRSLAENTIIKKHYEDVKRDEENGYGFSYHLDPDDVDWDKIHQTILNNPRPIFHNNNERREPPSKIEFHPGEDIARWSHIQKNVRIHQAPPQPQDAVIGTEDLKSLSSIPSILAMTELCPNCQHAAENGYCENCKEFIGADTPGNEKSGLRAMLKGEIAGNPRSEGFIGHPEEEKSVWHRDNSMHSKTGNIPVACAGCGATKLAVNPRGENVCLNCGMTQPVATSLRLEQPKGFRGLFKKEKYVPNKQAAAGNDHCFLCGNPLAGEYVTHLMDYPTEQPVHTKCLEKYNGSSKDLSDSKPGDTTFPSEWLSAVLVSENTWHNQIINEINPNNPQSRPMTEEDSMILNKGHGVPHLNPHNEWSVECPTCNASGENCPTCGGYGEIPLAQGSNFPIDDTTGEGYESPYFEENDRYIHTPEGTGWGPKGIKVRKQQKDLFNNALQQVQQSPFRAQGSREADWNEISPENPNARDMMTTDFLDKHIPVLIPAVKGKNGGQFVHPDNTCPQCVGQGHIGVDTCPNCGGVGNLATPDYPKLPKDYEGGRDQPYLQKPSQGGMFGEQMNGQKFNQLKNALENAPKRQGSEEQLYSHKRELGAEIYPPLGHESSLWRDLAGAAGLAVLNLFPGAGEIADAAALTDAGGEALGGMASKVAPTLLGKSLMGAGESAFGGGGQAPAAPIQQNPMLARVAEYETPMSNPDVGIKSNDPEKVDQKEFNDGDKNPKNILNPNLEDFGNSWEDEAKHQFKHDSPGMKMLEENLPLVIKFYMSDEPGSQDPTIMAIHNALNSEVPGYLDNVTEDMQKMTDDFVKGLQSQDKKKPEHHDKDSARHSIYNVDPNSMTQAIEHNVTPQGGAPVAEGIQQPGTSMCPTCGSSMLAGQCTNPQCAGNPAGAPQAAGQQMQQQLQHPQTFASTDIIAALVESSDHQGPVTEEQFKAVEAFLEANGLRDEIAELRKNPSAFAEVLDLIQHKESMPKIAPEEQVPQMPAQPTESAPGSMPSPGMGNPGGQPMAPIANIRTADALFPPCPRCGKVDGFEPYPWGVGMLWCKNGACQHIISPKDLADRFNNERATYDAEIAALPEIPHPHEGNKQHLISYIISSDNVAKKCPKCNSHTTGILNGTHSYCHACKNVWEHGGIVDGGEENTGVTAKIAGEGDEPNPVNAPASEREQPYNPENDKDTSLIWHDIAGQRLVPGHEYKMVSPRYPIPDVIRVDRLKPDEMQITFVGMYQNEGSNTLDVPTNVTPQEVKENEISFEPISGPTEPRETPPGTAAPEHLGPRPTTDEIDNSFPPLGAQSSARSDICPECEYRQITSSLMSPEITEYECLRCAHAWQITAAEEAVEELVRTADLSWINESGSEGFDFNPNRHAAMAAAGGQQSRNIKEIAGRDEVYQTIKERLNAQKLAGKKFTQAEERELIDEDGDARNADKLDLEGTHYLANANDDLIPLEQMLFAL